MRTLIPTLIGLLMSFSAFGQIKHLVFQVNGTLVQGIPSKNVSNVKQGKLITVSHGGRSRYFAVYEKISELIFALQAENNVVIHFYDDDPGLGFSILGQVPLVGKHKMNLILADQVSKIYGPSDLVSGKFDLEKLSSEGDVYFITSREKDEGLVPAQNLLKVGKEIFYFESFSQASIEEQALRANGSAWADTYFATEDVWKQSMGKAKILYSMLIPSLFSRDFQNSLQEAKDKNFEEHLKLGANMAEHDFLRYRLALRLGGDRLLGCEKVENLTGKIVSSYDLQACIGLMSMEVRYVKNAQNEFSCEIETSAGEKALGIGLRSCLQLKQYRARLRYDKKVCSAFSGRGEKISTLLLGECDGSEIYVKDPQSENYLFGKYDASMAGLSEFQISELLRDVPEVGDLYKLWFPYERDESVGFSWRDCRVASQGYHPIREENGVLAEECEGDTFYSWGPQIKLDNLKQWMGAGQWQDTFRPLFMARTPIGSFGYGPVSLRVKLRDDITWRKSGLAHNSCDNLDLNAKKNSAIYRTMSMRGSHLLDIIICSPHPIHSWSYGTKEHYDEIVKDYLWTVKNQRSENIYEIYVNNIGWLFDNISAVDSKDFRYSTLESYVEKHLRTSTGTGGEIFFNPTLRGRKNREDHFSTAYPIYFNEN